MFHVPGFIDARLEVVGEKENGPLACLPRARPFSLSPIACVASVSISNYCAKVRAGAKKIGRRGRGEEVPSFPSSFSVIPFFFALVPTFSTNSRGNACYPGYFAHYFQAPATQATLIQILLIFGGRCNRYF